ncbi:DUF6552 family protein [Sulfitobacter delicatus]|uniref:Ubiquinone biosynthesis methyltransferase UbiE n=1 Tax=Sulfitobacter delicatus TaxID=218672 RepID=A0A1G7HK18_9RHOB|nr:DUF6552 family protein [Sulfitobacter delicatus]SDF00686.1 hypothetical protein SAMN04489759_101143 [Sulfitobacter delicatus]
MTVTDYIPRLPASRIFHRDNLVTGIKWGASLVQIAGYTATAMGFTPLNIYLFLIGLVGWFAVGVFWRDRAIMLIHVVALGAMLVGLAGS